MLKSLVKIFCPKLYKKFHFPSYFFDSAWELQNFSVFAKKKKKKLFSAPLQLEQILVDSDSNFVAELQVKNNVFLRYVKFTFHIFIKNNSNKLQRGLSSKYILKLDNLLY